MGRVACFANICPLDSDLSGGKRYPPFEQLGRPEPFEVYPTQTMTRGSDPMVFASASRLA